MALMQNCKMANPTSNSTASVFTENDIPGAVLERPKSAKLRRRSLCSLNLVVLGAIMNTVCNKSEKKSVELPLTSLSLVCVVILVLFELQ